MRRRCWWRQALVLAVVAALVPLTTFGAYAQTVPPGPLDLSGEIDGAPFRIVVPDSWNGTLLVFAHGLRDKADHPGEIDDRSAPLANTPAVAEAAFQQGYALAGTAYKDNGWAVKEGLEDVRALASYFKDNVANSQRRVLWGASLGTVITLETAERTGGLFDGYLAACAVGAGAPRGAADGTVALRLAYDVAFGMPASWGTPDDVRDDVDFQSEVQPRLAGLASDPASFGRLEFVRLVVGIPGRGSPPPPGSSQPACSLPCTTPPRPPPNWSAGPAGQSVRT